MNEFIQKFHLKMKLKRVINEFVTNLGYLYVNYQTVIYVTKRKTNANSRIQIKAKNDKKEIYLTLNYNCSNKKNKVIEYRSVHLIKQIHLAANPKQIFFLVRKQVASRERERVNK